MMAQTLVAVALLVATAPDAPRTWASFQAQIADTRSRSVGAPNGGSLERGVPLPEGGDGYQRRDSDTHYGTAETIALIEYAGAQLAAAFPGTAPLFVGDISAEDGGRLRPHKSHQSGRDVDIGFLELDNRERQRFNKRADADDLDYAKSWFVMETLLMTGRVQYVFANRTRLAGLMEAAAQAGWSDEDIDGLFLEPGESPRVGVIRDTAGHTAHFHVRFRCPDGADGCESY